MLLSTDGNIAAIHMKEKGNFRAKKIKPPLVAAANRERLNYERILLKKGKSCKIGMQKIIRRYGYIILWIKRKTPKYIAIFAIGISLSKKKNIDIRRLKFQSSLTKRHTVVTILT